MIRYDKTPLYEQTLDRMTRDLKLTTPIDRGSWQSTAAPSPVRELEDVILQFDVGASQPGWAERIYSLGAAARYPVREDDLKVREYRWAEDHFQERVSGEPLNPAPSYEQWPWHSNKHKERFKNLAFDIVTDDFGNKMKVAVELEGQPFDHTYPERMWPTRADEVNRMFADPLSDSLIPRMRGIRFRYGDLEDVVNLLERDPYTRQAYLPIWFPEDTGSTEGQRVPCTLGYHFIRYGPQLQIKYFIRSCDVTRHLHNDVYMAGRLLQWMCQHLEGTGKPSQGREFGAPWPGELTMFISNLHMFTADEWRFQ